MASEQRLVAAIETITRETGYPPTPEELADAARTSIKSVHSTLMQAKRAGRVRYDEWGRFVLG